jgi:hypothetical protein
VLSFDTMFSSVPSKVRRPAGALLAALLAAPLAATPGTAQDPARRPGEVVATEQVEVLTLDVLAVDKKYRPVFGLVAADAGDRARDTAAVRGVTLQLPPGRWELKVSVHDALGDAYGTGVLRVDAPR